MILRLSQRPKIMAFLVRAFYENSQKNTGHIRNLAKTLVNSFFDNLTDDESWEQDLIVFLSEIIKVKIYI